MVPSSCPSEEQQKLTQQQQEDAKKLSVQRRHQRRMEKKKRQKMSTGQGSTLKTAHEVDVQGGFEMAHEADVQNSEAFSGPGDERRSVRQFDDEGSGHVFEETRKEEEGENSRRPDQTHRKGHQSHEIDGSCFRSVGCSEDQGKRSIPGSCPVLLKGFSSVEEFLRTRGGPICWYLKVRECALRHNTY